MGRRSRCQLVARRRSYNKCTSAERDAAPCGVVQLTPRYLDPWIAIMKNQKDGLCRYRILHGLEALGYTPRLLDNGHENRGDPESIAEQC